MSSFAQSAVLISRPIRISNAFHFARNVYFSLQFFRADLYSLLINFWHPILGQGDPDTAYFCTAAPNCRKNMKSTHDRLWLMEGLVGKYRGIHQGQQWQGTAWEATWSCCPGRPPPSRWGPAKAILMSGAQPPRDTTGGWVIFHSFLSPPLHPSLHQATRLSPPCPCAPSTSCLPYLPRIFRDIW